MILRLFLVSWVNVWVLLASSISLQDTLLVIDTVAIEITIHPQAKQQLDSIQIHLDSINSTFNYLNKLLEKLDKKIPQK